MRVTSFILFSLYHYAGFMRAVYCPSQRCSLGIALLSYCHRGNARCTRQSDRLAIFFISGPNEIELQGKYNGSGKVPTRRDARVSSFFILALQDDRSKNRRTNERERSSLIQTNCIILSFPRRRQFCAGYLSYSRRACRN